MRSASCAFAVALSLGIAGCVSDSPATVVLDSGNPADTGAADVADAGAPVDAAIDADAPGLYVSATSGNDTNPGTKPQPLKTLKKALSLAKSSDTVFLLPGTYDDANGETYPETVPDGVAIAGTSGVSATLASASKANGLVFAGGGSLANVTLTSFAKALTVTTGVQTFGPLTVNASVAAVNTVLDASGSAKPAVTALAAAGASVVISCSGTATVTGDKVTSPAPAVAGRFLFAIDSCAATVTGSTLVGSGNSVITLQGNASVVLDTTTIDKGVDAIITSASSTLTLKGGAITNASRDGINGGGAITLDGTTISGVGRMAIEQSSGTLNAKNCVLSGNAVGTIYSQAASLTLRACTLKNSPFGVMILGNVNLDMGTTNAPGNNVCSGMSSHCLDVTAATPNAFNAQGNTWILSIQGADGTGKYAAGLTSAGLFANSAIPLSGLNYAAKSDNSQKIYLGL